MSNLRYLRGTTANVETGLSSARAKTNEFDLPVSTSSAAMVKQPGPPTRTPQANAKPRPAGRGFK